jgi:hypothetical protein
MKVGFETVFRYLPAEVFNVRSHYAYLEPAIAKMPESAQETLRSTAVGSHPRTSTVFLWRKRAGSSSCLFSGHNICKR